MAQEPIYGQLAAEHLWPAETSAPDPDDLEIGWSPGYSTWTPCEDRVDPQDPIEDKDVR